MVNQLYRAVVHLVIGNGPLLDLYCGTGIMTCVFAKYFDDVIGVDSHRDAIKDAKNNAKRNNVNVQFFCDDVIHFLNTFHVKPKTVILDPPRQGCSNAVIDKLIEMNPDQIIYVSCYPDTLGRDLRQLCDSSYAIQSIQGADMFRHTPHIEAVVSLIKKLPV